VPSKEKVYGPRGTCADKEYWRHYKWCRKYGYQPYPEYLSIAGKGRMNASIYGPPGATPDEKDRHRCYCRKVVNGFIPWTEYQRRIGKAPKAEEPTFRIPKEEIIAKFRALGLVA